MSLDSRFEGKEGSYQFEACELVIPLLDIDIMGIPFSFLRFVNLETDYALRSPTPLWLLAFITFPGLEFAWLVPEFDPLLAYRIVNLLLPSLSSVLSESPRASSGFSQYGCFLGSASLSVKKIRMPPGLPIGSPTHPPAIQYRPHPLSQSVPLVSVSDDSCLDSSGRTATGACFPCVGRVPSEDEANPDSRNTQATTFSFGPPQTMVTAPETESILASLHLSLPSFFASLFYRLLSVSDAWRALALVLVNLSLLPSLPVVGLSFSFLSALSRSGTRSVYASAPAETGFGENTSRATDRSESLSPTNGSAPIFPTAISAICAWTRSTGYGSES
ncbi:hypothetical protein VNO80_33881 [Phaseolus coccineus]|uniref:Uncharacterized protein n=1 Tax=Phaseolus coccineus TaxID=3886 RepID=A0AAN9Q5T9_PHACN